MGIIIESFLFIIACLYIFYLPGKFAISKTYRSLGLGKQTFLSFPVGISIFLIGVYFFSWINFSYLYLFFPLAIIIYAVIKDQSLFRFKIGQMDLYSLGIIILGSVIFFSLTAFSFIHNKTGIQFIGTINVIDGLLHVAYVKNLLFNFPPKHAGLAGIPLRGYHYFYDLLISKFVLFFNFSPEDLYYRFFSFFISLIYGGGFYLFTNKLTKNKISQRLVLFFAYFAQSSAFVLSFFIHSINSTAELGSIYPLELILNPSIILSIGMLLSAIFVLLLSKPNLKQMILIGFLIGIIFELKVYTGIIGLITFFIVLTYRTAENHKSWFIYSIGFLTAIITIAVTYIPNNFGAGSLWFSPFFAYSFFMQDPLFSGWNWEIQRIIFRDHNNIIRLTILYIEAIGLFWISTLGSRIIMILGITRLLKISFWKKEENITVLTLITTPILIGSLFVQSISIFDTKQFFWIAGSFIAIPAGIVSADIASKSNKFFRIVIIFILVFLSFGGVIGQLNNFLFHPQRETISSSDVRLLVNAGKYVPKKSFIIYFSKINSTPVSSFPFSSAPVVAAFSGVPTYFEAESAQFDINSIYKERKKNLALLSHAFNICSTSKIKNLLKKIGSQYFLSDNKEQCLMKISNMVKSSISGLTFYIIKG